MCSVNAARALLREVRAVHHREPRFHSAAAIQKCTASLLLLLLPRSLTASPALAPSSSLLLAPAPQPLLCPNSSSAKALFSQWLKFYSRANS